MRSRSWRPHRPQSSPRVRRPRSKFPGTARQRCAFRLSTGRGQTRRTSCACPRQTAGGWFRPSPSLRRRRWSSTASTPTLGRLRCARSSAPVPSRAHKPTDAAPLGTSEQPGNTTCWLMRGSRSCPARLHAAPGLCPRDLDMKLGAAMARYSHARCCRMITTAGVNGGLTRR